MIGLFVMFSRLILALQYPMIFFQIRKHKQGRMPFELLSTREATFSRLVSGMLNSLLDTLLLLYIRNA